MSCGQGESPRNGGRSGWLLFLALVPYALLVWKTSFVCDDAFIVYRYARNLAAGLGVRYNAGVEPPVEGYTQFGWVLWMALFERLGGDPTVWSRVTSVACGAALIVYVWVFVGRRVTSSPPLRAVTAVFLGTLPPMVVWSTGGLGTMPFALVHFAVFERLLGDPERPRGLWAGSLAGLGSIQRADGPYFGGLVLALGLATALRRGDRRLLGATFRAGVILVTVSGAYVLWRYTYYQDLLPNTAYVKMAAARMLERGANYVVSTLFTMPAPALLLLAGPPLAGGGRRGLAIQAAAMSGVSLLYGVLVGGDFMAYGRFLVPALPFAAILLGLLLDRMGGRSAARSGLALVAGVLASALSLLPLFGASMVPSSWMKRFHFRWTHEEPMTEYEKWERMRTNTETWTLLGKALRLHTKPGESLVHSGIGAVGYYSGLFLYDQHGLVTREVARREGYHPKASPGHDKFVEPGFFIARNPTYILAMLVGSDSVGAESVLYEGRLCRRVLIPLSVEEGFPPETALHLWKVGPR